MTNEISNFCEKQMLAIQEFADHGATVQDDKVNNFFTQFNTELTKISESPTLTLDKNVEAIVDLQELNKKLDDFCKLVPGRLFWGLYKTPDYKKAEAKCEQAKKNIQERINSLSITIKKSDADAVTNCVRALTTNVNTRTKKVITEVFRFVEIEKANRSLDILLKIYPYGGWILKSNARKQVETICNEAKKNVQSVLNKVNDNVSEIVNSKDSRYIPLSVTPPLAKSTMDIKSFYQNFKTRLRIIPAEKWRLFATPLEKAKKIFLEKQEALEELIKNKVGEKEKDYLEFLVDPETHISKFEGRKDEEYEEIVNFLKNQSNVEQANLDKALHTLAKIFPHKSDLLLIQENNEWKLYKMKMKEKAESYLITGKDEEKSKELLEQFLTNYCEKFSPDELPWRISLKLRSLCPKSLPLSVTQLNWDAILKDKGWTWSGRWGLTQDGEKSMTGNSSISRKDHRVSKADAFGIPPNLSPTEMTAYRQLLDDPANNLQAASQLLQSQNSGLKTLMMSFLKEEFVKNPTLLNREEITHLLAHLLIQQKSLNRDQLLNVIFDNHPTLINLSTTTPFQVETAIQLLQSQNNTHLKQMILSLIHYKLDAGKIADMIDNRSIFFLLEAIAIEEKSESRHSLLSTLLQILTNPENFKSPYRNIFREIYQNEQIRTSFIAEKINRDREEKEAKRNPLPPELKAADGSEIPSSHNPLPIDNHLLNIPAYEAANDATRQKIQNHLWAIGIIQNADLTLQLEPSSSITPGGE